MRCPSRCPSLRTASPATTAPQRNQQDARDATAGSSMRGWFFSALIAVALLHVPQASAQEACWFDADVQSSRAIKTCSSDTEPSADNCTNDDTLSAKCTAQRPPGCECDGYKSACDCPPWILKAGFPARRGLRRPCGLVLYWRAGAEEGGAS